MSRSDDVFMVKWSVAGGRPSGVLTGGPSGGSLAAAEVNSCSPSSADMMQKKKKKKIDNIFYEDKY